MPKVAGLPDEMFKHAEEQEKKKHEETRSIKVFDDVISDQDNLFSWGYTEELMVTKGIDIKTRKPIVEYRQFKIKSVGMSELMEEIQNKAPVPPASLRAYKADSDVARQLGRKHDVVVYEVNEADPGFQRAKRKHETDSAFTIVLYGIAHDLKLNGEIVLNGSDITRPSVVVDQEKALQAVKNLGMSSEHFGMIVRNIRELTQEREAEEDLE